MSGGVRPSDLPELQRRAVMAALGIVEPDDIGRSILAEEIKNEIFDGAAPYSTYVRGVIIDGDCGVLLTGRDDSALIIEG